MFCNLVATVTRSVQILVFFRGWRKTKLNCGTNWGNSLHCGMKCGYVGVSQQRNVVR